MYKQVHHSFFFLNNEIMENTSNAADIKYNIIIISSCMTSLFFLQNVRFVSLLMFLIRKKIYTRRNYSEAQQSESIGEFSILQGKPYLQHVYRRLMVRKKKYKIKSALT